MRRAVLPIVAVLLLAGCGASSSKTASSTSSGSTAPGAVADTVFAQVVQEQGLTKYGPVTELQQAAGAICRAYDNGHTFTEVIGTLASSGWSGYDAGRLNGDAVGSYCQQYANKAP